MAKERTEFCTECRKNTAYVLQKRTIFKMIRDKEYRFEITVAVCAECGEEMSLPGLIDQNIREIDTQYRSMEKLISISDIERLMKIYKIGKTPLSLALGFGEITVTRYLSGQVPSKEYSDIMKNALESPDYMLNMLTKNKSKLADAAYCKTLSAARNLKRLFSLSPKILQTISYVFETMEEVTPLMLQKLLYFVQGLHLVFFGTPMFKEDCEAWIHGPVYPDVYNLFRDFKYNPIEDNRFAILHDKFNELTTKEKELIDLVIHSFGIYSGKTLEQITHNEVPWQQARKGYADGIYSHEILPKDSIKVYYEQIDKDFGIHTISGLKGYIHHMLSLT